MSPSQSSPTPEENISEDNKYTPEKSSMSLLKMRGLHIPWLFLWGVLSRPNLDQGIPLKKTIMLRGLGTPAKPVILTQCQNPKQTLALDQFQTLAHNHTPKSPARASPTPTLAGSVSHSP